MCELPLFPIQRPEYHPVIFLTVANSLTMLPNKILFRLEPWHKSENTTKGHDMYRNDYSVFTTICMYRCVLLMSVYIGAKSPSKLPLSRAVHLVF